MDSEFAQDMSVLTTTAGISSGVLLLVVNMFAFVIDAVPTSEVMAMAKHELHPTRLMSVDPMAGNVIDGVTMTLDLVDLIVSWPLAESKRDSNLRWAVS